MADRPANAGTSSPTNDGFGSRHFPVQHGRREDSDSPRHKGVRLSLHPLAGGKRETPAPRFLAAEGFTVRLLGRPQRAAYRTAFSTPAESAAPEELPVGSRVQGRPPDQWGWTVTFGGHVHGAGSAPASLRLLGRPLPPGQHSGQEFQNFSCETSIASITEPAKCHVALSQK